MGGLLETIFLILAIIVYILQFLRKEKEEEFDPKEIPLPRPKKSQTTKPKAKETVPKKVAKPETEPKLRVEPTPTRAPVLEETVEGATFFSKFSHLSEEEKLVVYSEILNRKDY